MQPPDQMAPPGAAPASFYDSFGAPAPRPRRKPGAARRPGMPGAGPPPGFRKPVAPPPGFAPLRAPPGCPAAGPSAPAAGPVSMPPPPPGFEAAKRTGIDGSAGYGSADFRETMFVRGTAPREWQYKWDVLWSMIPAGLREDIQMDEVALFSVTDSRRADHMSRLLLSLPGITEASTVTDATACVGGNAISFLRYFAHVNAIEFSRARLDMLSHNVRVCRKQAFPPEASGLGAAAPATLDDEGPTELERPLRPLTGSLAVYAGDCAKICPALEQDVIFFDPPWGGPEYAKQDKVRLMLSLTPLSSLCETLGRYTRYLVIKSPVNADLAELVAHPSLELVKECMLGPKMKLVVVRSLVAPQQAV